MKKVGKKNIYLLILLIISLIGIIITPSYAKFVDDFTTEEDIVGVNFSFDLNISNIEEYEEITIEPESFEAFNVEIVNNTGNTAYYGIWYKMVNQKDITDDIIISRLTDNEITTSGSLDNASSKTATIVIINNTTDNIKVNIGVNSSNTSTNDIEYLGGKKLISRTIDDPYQFLEKIIYLNI